MQINKWLEQSEFCVISVVSNECQYGVSNAGKIRVNKVDNDDTNE